VRLRLGILYTYYSTNSGKTSKWFLFSMVFVEMVLVFVDMVLVFVDMVLVLFIMVLVFVDMVFNNLFQPYLK